MRWTLTCFPLFGTALLFGSLSAACQNVPPPAAPGAGSQLSPRGAYDDALYPLAITRQDIANWSDIEIAAMNVSIGRAKAACAARPPATYMGADLIDLSRLCGLGQDWPAVVAATTLYIDAVNAPRPLLEGAYVARVDAELRLKREHEAMADSETLLATMSYTPAIAESVEQTVGYFRFLLTPDALRLATERQVHILAALRAAAALKPKTSPASGNVPGSVAPNAAPAIPIEQLYQEGLDLAELQQLSTLPAAAANTVAQLEAALPLGQSGDEALLIAGEQRRYALLGQALPPLGALKSLQSPKAKLPTLPAPLTVTALLLFPDWCAQCIRMSNRFPETVFSVEGHSAYLYGLLAQTVPAKTPERAAGNVAFNPAYAAAMLAGTPTVTVKPELLDRPGATKYPLLLLTDANGILRVLEPITARDLEPGGDLDAAIALVGKAFPAVVPRAAPAARRTPSAPR